MVGFLIYQLYTLILHDCTLINLLETSQAVHIFIYFSFWLYSIWDLNSALWGPNPLPQYWKCKS